MGQAGRMIGDGVDVEEHCAGDVAGEIFRPRIAILRRQKKLASTMARSGAPRCSASQSVETK